MQQAPSSSIQVTTKTLLPNTSDVTTFSLDNLSAISQAEFKTLNRILMWAYDGDFIIEINRQKMICHAGDVLLVNKHCQCLLLPYLSSLTPKICNIEITAEWIDSFHVNYNLLELDQQHPHLHASANPNSCILSELLQQPLPHFVMTQLHAFSLPRFVKNESTHVQFQTQALAHSLIIAIVNHNPQAIRILSDNLEQTLAGQIRTLVIADLSRSWCIPDMAKACHMSESTLRRKAAQEVGSIVNFIHEIKMQEALHLLRYTSQSITKVASNLGYGSAAYFSSLFRQRFAICPRELRNNHNLSLSSVTDRGE